MLILFVGLYIVKLLILDTMFSSFGNRRTYHVHTVNSSDNFNIEYMYLGFPS